MWKANAFIVKSELDLFNNFTYFLTDRTLGDQFHQHDDRVMAGANALRTLKGSLADRPMQTTFGVQTPYDDIDLALTDAFQRSFLANVRSDKVSEGSIGITLGEKIGPFGALRWRYLASSPLTEDNTFRSPATSIFNGCVGYRYHNGWRIQLDVLNRLRIADQDR